METVRSHRRTPLMPRNSGTREKQFEKMNIVVISSDYVFCSKLARIGEAHHLAISIYWSADTVILAKSDHFDAAVIDRSLWETIRPALEKWSHLAIVMIRDDNVFPPINLDSQKTRYLTVPMYTTAESIIRELSEASKNIRKNLLPEEGDVNSSSI